jgi:hypothetical protein
MTAIPGSGIRVGEHLLIASPFTDRVVHGLRLGPDGFMWDSEETTEWDWPRQAEWAMRGVRHRRWGWLARVPVARRWAPRKPGEPASMRIFDFCAELDEPIEFVGSNVHLRGGFVARAGLNRTSLTWFTEDGPDVR